MAVGSAGTDFLKIAMAEEPIHRRLAAIMIADVVGYSRLMEADEAGTLAALQERRKAVLVPVARAYNGRIVKPMGDGVLVRRCTGAPGSGSDTPWWRDPTDPTISETACTRRG